MIPKIFVNKTANIYAKNRFLSFVIVVLVIGYCWNSILIMRALRYEKTILIPPHMTGTVEFVQGKPTDNYINELTRRITLLAANYSPATVRKQFDELLVYYAPESFPEAKKQFYSLAGRIEDSQVSSVFYINRYEFKKDSDEIIVYGDNRVFTGSTFVETKSLVYNIKYRVLDGKFEILSFTEKQ